MVKTRRTAARRQGLGVPALVMVLLAALAALLVGMAVPWTAARRLPPPSSCDFVGDARPHGSPPLPRAHAAWPGRPHQALSIFRPAATSAEEATPLPDDPDVQQLIAKLRVAEMKLEAKEERIKDLEKLVETKDELLASKDNLLASQDELRKVERRDNAMLNAQVLAFEHRLGCRNVLERVEFEASALRAANPRAQRRSVWRDIFDSDAAFFNKIVKTLDLGPQAEGMTPAQLQDVMAHEMIRMYEKYSDYIHNPGFSVITLRMDLMPPKEAAKQILICRKFGIAYAMYEIGERIHVPPPEVARILGEEDD